MSTRFNSMGPNVISPKRQRRSNPCRADASGWWVFALGCLLCTLNPVGAADPWHLARWTARAVLEAPKALAAPGVDTMGVKILCQGRARPDGADYRVLDAHGRPVPFQVVFHDAARYSLISFRAQDPREKFYIYFGNPQASRAPEEVRLNPEMGAGPPKGPWIPHHGLVLQTIQRPAGDDPETVPQMAKLIAGSPYKHGARYQRRIADGYNAFGSSDWYISIYRGWMQIPRAGTYQFCTISNEASFSFMDGKPLVHWPGRHTVQRGIHGEKHASVQLTAGLHYIEYYHEEATLDQMAFLGWRPAADPGPFSAIPEGVYTAPNRGSVTRYETRTGPLLVFEPVITDSVWPTQRHEGQYTRCRFSVDRAGVWPAGTSFMWDFGDGQNATGAQADHVYLGLARYTVTLTARGPAGAIHARWPLEIFEIEHVTDEFKDGQPRQYVQLARHYDMRTLSETDLKELAHLRSENDDIEGARAAGKLFVERFGSSRLVPEVRRLLAGCAIRLGKGGLDEAIHLYRASINQDMPADQKLEVLTHLILLLGIERDLPEKVPAIRAEAEQIFKQAKATDETERAYRGVLSAVGDVLLWHKKDAAARERYQQAELQGPFIPAQVRAARVGAYPSAIRDFITSHNYGAALDVVDRWERSFPVDKLGGQPAFWRGKLLNLRGHDREAARSFQLCLRLAPGAAFESEARWLLADSLEKNGQPAQARQELARLVASNLVDYFSHMAREKLARPARGKKE